MSEGIVVPDSSRASELRLYLIMGIVLVVSRVLASHFLLVYDDAFITFTYSRNLASGDGFVYFPGDAVLGTTAPLFGLLCSLFYLLHLPMPGAAVALNILLDGVVLYLTYFAVARERRVLTGLVFTAIFAVSPMVSRVSVGAMETSLYLAAALSAITLFVRGRRAPAFVIASLCYFLRPEALLLLALLGYMQIRTSRGRETARLALLSVVCLALPFLVIYVIYGQVLPQSVVAKSGSGVSLARVLRQFLAPDPSMTALLVPSVWGVVTILRARARNTWACIALVWGLIYVAAYSAARPHVWSWYGVPVYYSVILAATYGLVDLAVRVRASQWLTRAVPTLILAPAAVWIGLMVVKGPTPREQMVRDNIKTWCEKTITDPTTTIAASDVGVIGYYSRARIYDLVGLVWPPATGYDSWAGAVKDSNPDYLFLNVANYTVDMMRDPDLAAAYTPVVRFSLTPDAPLEIEKWTLPDGWAPEYIVYRRNDTEAR